MSKAEKFRAALKAAGAEGLSPADAARVAGGPGPLSNFTRRGEVVKAADSMNWVLNPDYQSKRKGGIDAKLPVKRKKKATKKPRRVKPNRKASPRPATPTKPPLTTLLLGNLAAAAAHLANTVRAEVEGVENNPALSAALDQHARAADLIEAAA